MVCREIRVSAEAVRRTWSDTELPLHEAAAGLGMSVDALRAHAKALGLPARRMGRREVIRPWQERQFRVLWLAGVSSREISRHFGCSYFAVINTAARLGLAPRGVGFSPKLTLHRFKEVHLRLTLEASDPATRRKFS